MLELKPDSEETCGLLERVGRGDRQAFETLLARYRPDLRLRCRIANYKDGKYRWFARVEPRA